MQRSFFQVLPAMSFVISFLGSSYMLFAAGFVVIEGSQAGYSDVGPWFSTLFIAGNLLVATWMALEITKRIRVQTAHKTKAPPSPFDNVLPREEPAVEDVIGRSA